MRRSDIISGAVVALFGLVTIFAIVPWQISGSSDYGIAPDVFPLALIWSATVFAVLLVATRLVVPKPVYEAPTIPAAEWLFIAGTVVFLTACYLAIDHLGFMVGGGGSIAALMLLMGERGRPLRLIAVSALTPVVIFLMFWRLFSVPLP